MKLAIVLSLDNSDPVKLVSAADCMKRIGKCLVTVLGIPPDQIVAKLIDGDVEVDTRGTGVDEMCFKRNKGDGQGVAFAVNRNYVQEAGLNDATFMAVCAMCTGAWTNCRFAWSQGSPMPTELGLPEEYLSYAYMLYVDKIVST